ncbi:MAG TPA: O-methyltransferase [bacterium]|nr:O-methyltransferase [bacterium]
MSKDLYQDLEQPALTAYLEGVLAARPPVLQEMEAYAAERRFPIVGPVVGQLFYLLTRIAGARRVYEMGSGFGYSTAWFAMAVRDNGGGEVHHVVWDDELSRRARGYLGRLGLTDVVRFTVGEAVAALRGTTGEFDVIFNDIEKDGYPASLPVMKAHVRRGGILLVDNMIWRGRVMDPAVTDAATQGVRELTRLLFSDPDLAGIIVPLRDGVFVGQKTR